ncbi:MAG: SLBB domain-containing protein, partial [bacterium]|nr:SLBB domain-containing protein [bacterium]
MTKLYRSLRCFGVWFCGLALLSGHLSGHAQTISQVQQLVGRQGELEKLFGGQTPTLVTGEAFFEGAVDADAYIVGPGDRLSIVFWQPTFNEYPTLVNGDGDVVIPYVGVVHVADLTLRAAKEAISGEVSRTMRVGRVTVSLSEPRRFRVHVTGMVTVPGTYILSATSRVADAITLAGGLKRRPTFAVGDTTSEIEASQRGIELWDRSGERLGYADLLLFERCGRVAANPYLRDGETIYVPSPAEANRQVGVFGEIQRSGLYEWANGERLETILAVAGGLTMLADSSSIRIGGRDGSEIAVDLRGESGRAARMRDIRPGDRIYVGGSPDTSRLGSVTIRGEVARPGGYPIVEGETTLREVLLAAGGVLPTAEVNSARLIRSEVADPVERERDRVLAAALRFNQLPMLAADPQLAAEFSRWAYRTVVVDLTNASDETSAAAQIRLRDGDRLEVPQGPLGVRVIGSVNHAGEVEWQPGAKLAHYLSEAGGINRGGWKGTTLVLKARNGSLIRYQSSLAIDPGDVIFVPLKPQATTWTLIKDAVAVTAQVATVILIVQ